MEVKILDETYALRSRHADKEQIKQLAQRVDVRLQDLRRRYPQHSLYRLGILAALNLANELTRLQVQQQQLISTLEERVKQLEEQLARQDSGQP